VLIEPKMFPAVRRRAQCQNKALGKKFSTRKVKALGLRLEKCIQWNGHLVSRSLRTFKSPADAHG